MSRSADVRVLRAQRARTIVVLDDDPTGSQSVHGVPIVTAWSADELDWAFARPGGVFFVLTNTRALGVEDASARLHEVVAAVDAAAGRAGVGVDYLLRGDSTLRGHYPLESDLLAERARAAGEPYDAVLIVPAYLEAGRVTRDGVHLVRRGTTEVPVGETDYARDATFGFASSELGEWVEEKTRGAVSASSVTRIGLDDLRVGGSDRARTLIESVSRGLPVVADAVERGDLDALAAGLLAAEAAGRRVLVRSGPTFVAALLGLDARGPLKGDELGGSGGTGGHPSGPGLVVVGSHVELTTRQLARLRERRSDLHPVELDVARVGGAPAAADEEIQRATDALAAALRSGDAVVSTSRLRFDGADAAASLALAGAVSRALVRVVHDAVAEVPPAWVVAKGGITSSDIATEALGIRRAEVLGQLFDGMVSVWADRGDGPLAGRPYVVFAGNVGDDDALVDAVDRLRTSRSLPVVG